MTDAIVRFFLCNIFVSIILVVFLLTKRLFRGVLSGRMQFNLWFPIFGLLAIPLISFCSDFQILSIHGFGAFFSRTAGPFSFAAISRLIFRISSFFNQDFSDAFSHGVTGEISRTSAMDSIKWMDDLALSANIQTPTVFNYILSGVWLAGCFVMVIFMIRSALRLRMLRNSALPLQNKKVRSLYEKCLAQTGITKKIPIYSTAYLSSPVIVGLIHPKIYLPISIISDFQEQEMRYILFHELQHYKHKDALANYLMNFAAIFYWFNLFVWYSLKEMRNDREIACDISVLEMLERDVYSEYGNTLLLFARKISSVSNPFTAGINSNKQGLKRRILNISSYKKPTLFQKLKSLSAFFLITVLLFSFAPKLSAYGTGTELYSWDAKQNHVTYEDLSAYFGEYEGSFVLYNLKQDTWTIHNARHATVRVSPDSTYKIYDALFGLEEGAITPQNSFLPWDQEVYPFEEWNDDQTLTSAMHASVNWYFQAIDQKLGSTRIHDYIKKIGYGNQNIKGGLSSYWMESTLKISPVEQVELLTKLYQNEFHFSQENIAAVTDSICLGSIEGVTKNASETEGSHGTTATGVLYGKTGTGQIDDQNKNGWFVGYVETADNTLFFAVNITAEQDATGSKAKDIALDILCEG